eukprot:738309-Prorocentrum_minimum.AAC.3
MAGVGGRLSLGTGHGGGLEPQRRQRVEGTVPPIRSTDARGGLYGSSFCSASCRGGAALSSGSPTHTHTQRWPSK